MKKIITDIKNIITGIKNRFAADKFLNETFQDLKPEIITTSTYYDKNNEHYFFYGPAHDLFYYDKVKIFDVLKNTYNLSEDEIKILIKNKFKSKIKIDLDVNLIQYYTL
jgi:hypothetical protein